LPWLYRHRPAWDILVLTLMLGGTALSVTSVIIGWRRLRRKLAQHAIAKSRPSLGSDKSLEEIDTAQN